MDALLLARLQFAMTIGFHFIFPPISIGLAWLICVAEWFGWRKGDSVYAQIGQFFGKLFAITFAVGVATGIVMEFQFGTNWSTYSKFVGDVFGAPLAAEGIYAFFLESTFVGLYLWGRGRVPKWLHWFSSLMVAVGATLSAFWIIAANSWQQTPAGFVVRNGRAEMTSFYEALFNPSTMPRYLHVMTAALVAGAFLMAGVAAYHLLRDSGSAFGRKALRISVACGLVFAVLEAAPIGHVHAQQVARTQPEKFAAIEGLYETRESAPMVVFAIPLSDPPRLWGAIEIPGLLPIFAFGDSKQLVRGLDQFPREDWPPLWITFVSFHNMVALGGLFIALMAWAAFRILTGKAWTDRLLLRGLIAAIPLPIVACQLGWITAEVGRQPWIVYKLLRTSAAHSPAVTASEILFSLLLFGGIYLFLGALWLFLMVKKAKAIPAPVNG